MSGAEVRSLCQELFGGVLPRKFESAFAAVAGGYADIAFLDVTLPLADNLKIVSESPHSRFPVCRGGLQDVLGVVSTKLMLSQQLRGEKTDLQAHLTQPLYVPETLNGMELLEQFKASSVHMAFLMDEYGELQGMVTQQDLLEAITG